MSLLYASCSSLYMLFPKLPSLVLQTFEQFDSHIKVTYHCLYQSNWKVDYSHKISHNSSFTHFKNAIILLKFLSAQIRGLMRDRLKK